MFHDPGDVWIGKVPVFEDGCGIPVELIADREHALLVDVGHNDVQNASFRIESA